MGIYDREYYRSSNNRLLDPWSSTGEVCKWLILTNIGVFVLQLLTLPRGGVPGFGPTALGPVTDALILDSGAVFSGQVWRLLTYAFLHSPTDVFHIIFNMLFLWWFGSELEGMYGPREFLWFYLISAVLGGVAFTAYHGSVSYAETQNLFSHHSCLGASGAVTAVLVLYGCHFPFRTILLFFFLPVPIWLFVAFQVFQDAYVFASGRDTSIAVTVHLAGALFGFLYYRNQWRVAPLFSGWSFKAPQRRPKPKLRVYRGEEPLNEANMVMAPRSNVDEQLEAKLDAVLEKIKTSGQESLSEPERQLLLRAAEIYRKRREGV